MFAKRGTATKLLVATGNLTSVRFFFGVCPEVNLEIIFSSEAFGATLVIAFKRFVSKMKPLVPFSISNGRKHRIAARESATVQNLSLVICREIRRCFILFSLIV